MSQNSQENTCARVSFLKHSYPSTDKEYDKWRAQRALRDHAPKYILQTGKLKNGNFVTIRFKGTELNFGL